MRSDRASNNGEAIATGRRINLQSRSSAAQRSRTRSFRAREPVPAGDRSKHHLATTRSPSAFRLAEWSRRPTESTTLGDKPVLETGFSPRVALDTSGGLRRTTPSSDRLAVLARTRGGGSLSRLPLSRLAIVGTRLELRHAVEWLANRATGPVVNAGWSLMARD
jgi:hypothetical protein